MERRELLAILIDSFADLQAMNQNLSGAYELTADVNCAENTLTPVGTSSSPFTGSLDGKGYKIISLRTSSIGYGGDPYVGLFGHASGATLNDVVLENADIDAYGGNDYGYLYVGGLAGKATNTSITDCEVSGDIDANAYGGVYAGGLVGYSSNTVHKDMLRSVTTCTVDGRAEYNSYGGTGYGGYVGGLAGRADALDIDQCSATGAVTAYGGSTYGGELEYAGGLVGYNYVAAVGGPNDGEILKSHATGNVQAYSAHAYGSLYAGGLIGYSYVLSSGAYAATTTVEECYATGTADAHGSSYSYGGTCPVAYAGGLIGYNYVANSSSGSATLNVTLSYATGLADADAFGYGGSSYGGPSPYAFAGGLIGYNYDTSSSSGTATTTVDQSFATGTADAYASIPSYTYGGAYAYSGGLVGYNAVSSSSTGTASSTIDESYATGTVNGYAYGGYYYGGYGGYYYGSAYSGGLVGYEYLYKGASATASATISNAYATGNATAQGPYDAVAGGLIGLVTASGTNAAVTNCYSIGVPDAQYDSTPLEGGLVGYSSNVTYTSCYWDTTTSGKTDGVDNVDPDPSGVTGKTTHEMMQQSTFSGWDFDCDGLGACHNGIWFMAGYPHLQMEQKFLLGGSIHITNVAELQSMQVDLDATYYLDNDIDASETADWNWDATDSVHRGFEPVGDSSAAFSGKLFGGGHKITGLFVNRKNENSVGLFGRVENATLDGVILENVDIDGNNPSTHLYAGALAGEVYRGTTISDCSVSGTVTAQTTSNFIQVGGLAGLLYSTASISGSASTCTVSGTATASGVWAGGLVGEWYPIDAAATTASVTQSYATGNVTASATSLLFTGGLIGELYIPAYSYGASATLSESYATGDVSATGSGAYTYAGGLIACLTSPGYNLTPTSVDVTDCYATGDATISENSGSSYAGGLIGILYTGSATVDIGNCYSIGDPSGADYNGGLVGHNTSGSFASCYWDTDTSGTTDGVDNQDPDPSGVTGRTTAQMRAQSTFTNWDFDASGVAARNNGTWIMAGYPHLQMEWSASITNVYQLQMMALDLDASYSLANDISASDTATWNWNGSSYEGFAPVGIYNSNPSLAKPFTGMFDGDWHVIEDLMIRRVGGDELGVFGYSTGTVKEVGFLNVSVDGDGGGSDNIGGLVGRNAGTIIDCYVTGTLDGNDDVGGIAGENELGTIERCHAHVFIAFRTNSDGIGGLVGDNDNGTIKQSYATGRIFGDYYAGGLVGKNDGVIQDSYATTDVEGKYYAGGLVGYNFGSSSSIVRCYAAGDVTGLEYQGGFVGYSSSSASIADCYAAGDVTGTSSDTGGFVGYHSYSSIVRSYASGSVTGTDNVGGFVGYNSGSTAAIQNSYAAGDVTGNTTGSSVGTFLGAGSTNSLSGNYYAGQAVNNGGGGTNTSGASSTTAAALRNASGTGAHAVYSTWNLTQTWKEHPAEEQFPYFRYESEVGTAAQMNAVRNNLFAVYRLNSNLDLSTYSNWDPIGDRTAKFHGALLGYSYTLDNLSINRDSEEDVGLFGYIGLGNVRDLTLTDVQVRGGSHVGALAGNNEGTVRRCTVKPSSEDPADYQVGATYCVLGGGVDSFVLSGTTYYTGANIGGLVGSHDGLLMDCTAQVLVSYNIVTRTGTYDSNTHISDVGGLAGDNNDGAVIRTSVADGDVVAQLEAITDLGPDQELGGGDDEEHNCKIGGLTGENDGLIQGTADRYCEATGMVQGVRQVGGLVCENDGTIEYARANGERGVYGARFVGGLAGELENTSADQPGIIRNCEATVNVIGITTATTPALTITNGTVDYEHVGGLVGQSEGGLIEGCHADGDVLASAHESVGGLVGSTRLSTAAGAVNHGEGAGAAVVVDSHATGSVYGANETGGLIGQNGASCVVARSYFLNTGAGEQVDGQDRVGGLVGENNGTIRTSYARMDLTRNSNQVSADDQIACFVGQNSGLIEDSFANGEVDGKSGTCNDVGGFVGLNSGTIRRSFFRGDVVDGDNDVGGFCGENASGGLIEYCYTVPTPSGNSNYSPFVRTNGGTVQYDYYTAGGDDGIAGTTEVAAATLLEVLNGAYTYTALFGNWTFDSTHWEVTSNGNDPELAWQD